MADSKYVVAIDQGTTSSRAIIFDHGGQIVATGQKEHEQIFPRAGWVEHDAAEIRDNTMAVIAEALDAGGASATDVAAMGMTTVLVHSTDDETDPVGFVEWVGAEVAPEAAR